MNEKCINVLEYPKILNQLADCCVTEAGKAFALQLEPLTQFDDITKALDETEEAVNMSQPTTFCIYCSWQKSDLYWI